MMIKLIIWKGILFFKGKINKEINKILKKLLKKVKNGFKIKKNLREKKFFNNDRVKKQNMIRNIQEEKEITLECSDDLKIIMF